MTLAPYGTSTYPYGDASRKYGSGTDTPFSWQVIIFDAAGNALEHEEEFILSAAWAFKRFGGCADGSLTVRKDFNALNYIGPGCMVKIYINTKENNVLQHVYTGYVANKRPAFKSADDYSLSVLGYAAQLSHIFIGTKEALQYSSGVLIENMVKDIVENLICPRTDIVYDASYIDASGVTLQAPISFQKRAAECIDDLAMLTGLDYEWGVDKNKKFYFRAASSAVQSFWYGAHLQEYAETEAYEQIRNRLFVKDGEFTDCYEYEPDLVLVENAAGIADALALGKKTTYKQVAQNVSTTDKTIARIIIKARTAGGSDGNLITDGDMETDAVANWPADGATPTISADTASWSHGAKSLKVETDVPYTGAHQEYVSPADGLYRLAFDYYVSLGSLVAIIDDAAGTELARSEVFLEADAGSKSYRRACIDFETAGSLASVNIRFLSTEQHKFLSGFKGVFYIDNVTLQYNASLVKGYLWDSSLSRQVGKECIVAVEGDAFAEYTFDVQLYGAVSGRTYAFRLETMSGLSDDYFFEIACDSPNTVTGGALNYYNGSTWTPVVGHNLYFKTYKNSSQEQFGLLEEQVSPVTKNSLDMQKWCNGYLAGLTQVFKRIELQLDAMRWILDDAVPAAGIGKVAARLGGGTPFPSQIVYSDATTCPVRYSTTQYYACQSFQHPYAFYLDTVVLRLKKTGTPAGNVWIELREDNYGAPADSGIVSDLIDVATLGAAADILFTFSAPRVEAYKNYWLAVCGDYAVSASNYVSVVINAVSDAYADGQARSASILLVPASVNYDFYFILSGTEIVDAYSIDTVQYSVSDSGLSISISAGAELPDAAKKLKQLEHNLTGYQQFLT